MDRATEQNILQIDIERNNADGIGVGHHAGREVLIFGAFAGERVEAGIIHRGRQRWIGRLRRVVKAHPARRRPPCAILDRCQGCPLMDLETSAQLKTRQELVRRALREAGLDGIDVPPVHAAPQDLGWRTSAKLAIGRNRRGVVIGLYRRGSHDIVDLRACPLHHPLINRVIEVAREEIARQKLPVWNPKQQRGLLRYLLVRVSPAFNKALVTIVTDRRDFNRVNALAGWLKRKVPEVIGIHQNVNASTGNVILGRETLKMTGAPDLRDRIGPFTIHLGPTSFLQVNPAQAEKMYATIADWLAPKEREEVLDLYCGIGGIAMHLAARGASVTGIEAVPEAIRHAERNARGNRLENCRFIAGEVEQELPRLLAKMPAGCPVVVNPPRTGCREEVLDLIAQHRPRTLIYMSCNPVTLARDLALLSGRGFKVEKLEAWDMFPQTAHVECLAKVVPQEGAKKAQRQGRSKPAASRSRKSRTGRA